jgi:hypothetical protein
MAKAHFVSRRLGKSRFFKLAVAACGGSLASAAFGQVTLNQISNSNWTITDDGVTAVFSPTGEEITNITLNGSGDLLRPGGGTSGSLDQEFAGTPFGAGAQTFNSQVGAGGSYVDVWTTVADTPGSTVNPFTYAFHYVMFANDPTIYTYETFSHANGDIASSVGQGQFLFRGNIATFQNLYQVNTSPNNLTYGPEITTGIASTNPNFATVTTARGTVQDSTEDMTGSGISSTNSYFGASSGDNGSNFFTKYDFSTYNQYYQAETMYGSQYAVTEVVPSEETIANGPTKQELAWTDPGILNMEFLSDHYGLDSGPGGAAAGNPGDGISVAANQVMSKFFGPFGFTISSDTSGSLGAAQVNQGAIDNIPNDISEFNEDSELIASGYTPASQRGNVSIVGAANTAGWSSTVTNNVAVLSDPNRNFQESNAGDNYWTNVQPNGNATINSVVPGTYQLTLYELGQWGQTVYEGVTVGANQTVQIGHGGSAGAGIAFVPENFGTAAPIWTIGTPNRSSNEFTNGHDNSYVAGSVGPDVREYYGGYDYWGEEAAIGNNGTVVYYGTAVGSHPATNDPNAWLANQWGTFDPNEWDTTDSTNDNYSKIAPAYVGAPASYHGSNVYTVSGTTYSGWTVHFTTTAAQLAQGQFVVLSVAMADLKDNLNVTLNLGGGAKQVSETWAEAESGTDDAMTRSGDSGFYEWAAFQFPTSDLNAAGADNTFTFGVPESGDGDMYDAIRMEITNTSASPASTGWHDYNYITSGGTTVQNDSVGQTTNNETAVPEPGSLLVTASAGLLCAFTRRRRQRKPV